MAKLIDMFVKIGALTDKESFNKAEGAVQSFNDKIVSIFKFAGAALATGAVAMAIQRTADRFNDLGDIAARVGNTTVKELDKLGYVAELTGSDAATAQASFENLSRTIGEASQGIGKGALIFEKLGLSAKNSSGQVKTTTEVLEDVKAKIEGLSAAEQGAYIQRLGLDKSMIGMLTSDTSEIISQYEKRTQALGINVDEAADLGAKYNDAIKVAKRGFDDIVTAIVIKILPPITIAIDRVSRLMNENIGLISSYIDPIAKAISIGADLVTGFITGIGKLFSVLDEWPLYLAAVGAAFKALSFIIKMSPIGKIITLVTTLMTVFGLLVDDFEVWKKGGKSFFGDLWQDFLDFKNKICGWYDNVVEFFINLFDSAWWSQQISNIGQWFSDLGDGIVKEWDNAIDSIRSTFKNAFDSIMGAVLSVPSDIAKAWSVLIGFYKALWSTIFDAAKNVFNGLMNVIDKAYAFITGSTDKLSDSIYAAIDGIVSDFSNAWNSIKESTGVAWDSILATVNNFYGSIVESIESIPEDVSAVWESILATVNNVFGSIVGLVKSIPEEVSSVWEDLKNGFTGALGAMWSAFTGWIADLFKSLGNLPSQLASSVKDKGIEVAKGAMSAVGSWFGFGGDKKESRQPNLKSITEETQNKLGANSAGLTASALPPSTVNNTVNNSKASTVDNSTRTVNQTFNVQSSEEAKKIAVATSTNMRAVQAGGLA